MTSPVIIKFKQAPELGKLKVVADAVKHEGCDSCALLNYNCSFLDKSDTECGGNEGNGYHYEKVK